MKKDLVLSSVQNSVSSIFYKEDVINLINSIEEGGRKISTLDIERAIDKVISWAENNERDLVDVDSVELELNYDNRIECVGVPIQLENLREALENNFMDFGEEEVEVEEFIRVTDVVKGGEFTPVAENEL
jgi:hypothetical protein